MIEKKENDNADLIDKKPKVEGTVRTSSDELLRKYAPKALFHIEKKEKTDESSFDFLIAQFAENALSADVLGRPGSNLNLILLEIDEVLTQEEAIHRIKRAEMHFLESLEAVKKLEALRKHEELEKTSEIIRSIRLGISRYNILFVIILIVGLTWAAINLDKDSLALVAAAIGGAITHLLAERNSVLSTRKGNCHCNDGDE